jgi:broad specificity phosphatase PhoE
VTPVIYYLSHPQVVVDPKMPVPDWGLSDIGRARARAAADAGWTIGITRIVSSAERKAIETAEIFARPRGLLAEVRPKMHENDRSATGYLAPPEFEALADAFFAAPFQSVRGWERAIDAQSRIVDEIKGIVEAGLSGNMLIVGHGAVGALLLAHLLKIHISRTLDQPAGGGNVFAFEPNLGQVRHRWCPIEDMVAEH